MAISRSIVDAVRSMKPPGRFLDKDPETGLWHDIGDRKAIEKTSQALRDGAADLRKQLSQDLGDPDFLNAVFETDNAKNNMDSINSGSNHSKEKAKPVKAKPPIKKGHRRTKSNPNTLEEKKKIFIKKQQNAGLVEHMREGAISPRTSIGSLPSSPLAGRPTFGRAASFDYVHASPYPGSPPPSNHMGSPYPRHTVSGTTLKCASFDSAQRAHSWQYTGRRSGHPPLSPSSMRGRHPLSPPGSYARPPISPVQKPAWSPGGYGRPSPPFRSWRASPSPYGYSPGELSVPTLGRKSSGASSPRVPLSPMRPSSTGAQENALYRPPPIMRAGSAEDFVPPLSPGSWTKPKTEKIIVAKSMKEANSTEMEVDDDDDAKYQSPNCTLFGAMFGGCFMMDTERSNVEVVLSRDKGETIEINPADEDNQSQRSISPLPFRRNESESSAANFFNALLQLPIAPCAPQDVE
uniref:DUF6824 domain-containing protein n=2 Tax=Amphora coffeiformis TaxID=265554 RepID=A0A7S3KXP0_9STRA|eukprot:scaffold1361_cov165-Amphora_coffeaeformis.AAC.3